MMLQRIPVTPETSDQTLAVVLGGNPYRLRVTWNERFGYWSLSIYTVAGDPLLEGIKMVTNYDLTSRFKDTRMPYGALYFVREKGPFKRPDYNDLDVSHSLYYYEPNPVVTPQLVYGRAAVTPSNMQFQDDYPYPYQIPVEDTFRVIQ